jgi:hypothetical protein
VSYSGKKESTEVKRQRLSEIVRAPFRRHVFNAFDLSVFAAAVSMLAARALVGCNVKPSLARLCADFAPPRSTGSRVICRPAREMVNVPSHHFDTSCQDHPALQLGARRTESVAELMTVLPCGQVRLMPR